MTSSFARRREAKAARRKKLLEERRKGAQGAESTSFAQRVRRLALQPVHCCLLHDGLTEQGNGNVILVRGTPASGLTMAAFLVDVFCLGVKDVVFTEIGEAELESYLASAEAAAPIRSVDPAYARKLLRDAAAYALALGFPPHKKYADAELLFGDVSADACETTFEFGLDGKPHYIPGPTETRAQIRRRLEILRRLGEGGFGYTDFAELAEDSELEAALLDLDEEEDADFALPSGLAYDPSDAPDSAEWLGLQEKQRFGLVADYHRRAGIESPNENLHATIHVVVENQIALGDPPAVRHAIDRLMIEGGLDRHEAVHAVGAVLAEHLWTLAKNEATTPEKGDDTTLAGDEAYAAAVDRLTAESWRQDFE